MPIYEYRCSECHHEVELMQSIKAPPATTCPACGKEGLQRLISSTSFVLKGSGWYQTDYGGKKPSPSASSESSDGGGGSGGTESSTSGSGGGGGTSPSGTAAD